MYNVIETILGRIIRLRTAVVNDRCSRIKRLCLIKIGRVHNSQHCRDNNIRYNTRIIFYIALKEKKLFFNNNYGKKTEEKNSRRFVETVGLSSKHIVQTRLYTPLQ